MGRLVIEGNSVYEIDEECVRRNPPPRECGIYEYLNSFGGKSAHGQTVNEKKRKNSSHFNNLLRNN